MQMGQSPDSWSGLVGSLDSLGMSVFGGFEIFADDCPGGKSHLVGRPAVLIGNAGSGMWVHFSQSPEFADQLKNPLDRWTGRVLRELAGCHAATAIFPFEKPYWPFQKFAKRAGHALTSPLGILIHPRFGLWHGFRGVLVWEETHEFASHIIGLSQYDESLIHPCESCVDRPCLSACPVGAFDGKSLERDICHQHLRSKAMPDCMSLGCRARSACPVGKEFEYGREQLQFHMKAYGPRMI